MARFFFEKESSHAPTSFTGASCPPSSRETLKSETTLTGSEGPQIAGIGKGASEEKKSKLELDKYPIRVYPGTFRTYIDLTIEEGAEDSLHYIPQLLGSNPVNNPVVTRELHQHPLASLVQDGDHVLDPVSNNKVKAREEDSVEGLPDSKLEDGDEDGSTGLSYHEDKGPSHLKDLPQTRSNGSLDQTTQLVEFVQSPSAGEGSKVELENVSDPCDKSVGQLDDLLPDAQTTDTESIRSDQKQHGECRSCGSISRKTSFEAPIFTKSSAFSQLPCPAKTPLNRLSCEERKRIIVTNSRRPEKVTQAMQEWVSKMNNLLDPLLSNEECWFHPSPPAARRSSAGVLRPYGKIQKKFSWQDDTKHSLDVNYGIVWKLIFHKMTKLQKDGFVNRQWHLSHLCGNWTCLNPEHTTVEPGEVNISRNNCFSHRSGCSHQPPCLKDKKVALGADGRPIKHKEADFISSMHPPGCDDWQMEDFEDDYDGGGETASLISPENLTHSKSSNDLTQFPI